MLRAIGGFGAILLLALGLIMVTTGTRVCGNVEDGKDPRSALITGDTVPAAALPRDSAGNLAYDFHCTTTDRLLGDNFPYLVVGLLLVVGILAAFALDWRDRRKKEIYVENPDYRFRGRT